jgi:hypothetical protein
VTKAEERRFREVAGALEAVHAELNEMVSTRQEPCYPPRIGALAVAD